MIAANAWFGKGQEIKGLAKGECCMMRLDVVGWAVFYSQTAKNHKITLFLPSVRHQPSSFY